MTIEVKARDGRIMHIFPDSINPCAQDVATFVHAYTMNGHEANYIAESLQERGDWIDVQSSDDNQLMRLTVL